MPKETKKVVIYPDGKTPLKKKIVKKYTKKEDTNPEVKKRCDELEKNDPHLISAIIGWDSDYEIHHIYNGKGKVVNFKIARKPITYDEMDKIEGINIEFDQELEIGSFGLKVDGELHRELRDGELFFIEKITETTEVPVSIKNIFSASLIKREVALDFKEKIKKAIILVEYMAKIEK